MVNESLQKFYEQHHVSGNRLRQSVMEETRARLFSEWIGQGKRVLDLGCRDGTLTRHYVEGNDLIGGDIDISAVPFASDTYGFMTQCVDLNNVLPFEERSFVVVVMAEVLEHLPYPVNSMQEVHRVLKPGGALIGNVPLAYHLKDRYEVMKGNKFAVACDQTHVRFSYDDIQNALENSFSLRRNRRPPRQKLGKVFRETFCPKYRLPLCQARLSAQTLICLEPSVRPRAFFPLFRNPQERFGQPGSGGRLLFPIPQAHLAGQKNPVGQNSKGECQNGARGAAL